jgi:hypothetical protein
VHTCRAKISAKVPQPATFAEICVRLPGKNLSEASSGPAPVGPLDGSGAAGTAHTPHTHRPPSAGPHHPNQHYRAVTAENGVMMEG